MTLLQPIALLAVIIAGYLFKRCRLFGQRDYRIIQVMLFDLVLPGAIVYSFATNPHDPSLLWLSAFGFVVALVPVLVIFSATRHSPVTQRAFLMLNATGLNIGCFCFPVVQAFLGEQAIVPAAMFDIGNCIMVAAGTNVMTQTLLHIQPGRPLTEQGAGDAPTLPYTRPTDRDAKRLARRSLLRTVLKGFVGSIPFDTYVIMIVLMVCGLSLPAWFADRDAKRLARRSLLRTVLKGFVGSIPFDTYVIMIVLMVCGLSLPAWFADLFRPLSNANACVAMLMVGMMMDLPANRSDTFAVLKVLAWRLPFGLAFAAVAWFLLPFDAGIREATMMCCLAPVAVFSTLFTDEVLGNARLAGFTLSVSAVISLGMMTGAHAMMMCCLAPVAVFSTLFTDEVLGNARLAGFTLSVSAVISLGMMTGAHAMIAAGII